MRREDKRLIERVTRALTGSLGVDCGPRQRQLEKSLRPVVMEMIRDADRAFYESLKNMRVRSIYRPRLPQ